MKKIIMKKSIFGSILSFILVVGLSLALSANPNDPKKTETTKGCCSSKAKTEKAACSSTEKKDCADKKEDAACGEKKVENASADKKTEKATTTVRRRTCCSGRN